MLLGGACLAALGDKTGTGRGWEKQSSGEGGGRGTPVFLAVVSSAITMACVGFFCHCFPWPWCVPAKAQTAKDSSRQDLMTHVIFQRETCPQRQPDPSPQALSSSRALFSPPTLPSVTKGQSRDSWKSAINVPVGSPGVSPLPPLPPWGADEEVE